MYLCVCVRKEMTFDLVIWRDGSCCPYLAYIYARFIGQGHGSEFNVTALKCSSLFGWKW